VKLQKNDKRKSRYQEHGYGNNEEKKAKEQSFWVVRQKRRWKN